MATNEALASTDPCPAARAAALAERLLVASLAIRTHAEQEEMERLSGLVRDPASKKFSMTMTDRLWRTHSVRRAAAGFRNILDAYGHLSGFRGIDRAMLKLAGWVSCIAPTIVIRAIRNRMRRESAKVILPAEDPGFARYLKANDGAGRRANINQLGEAVLGEREANARLERVIALLERPDVNYVSVKLSAIYSQISLVAWEATLEALGTKLRRLYRAAAAQGKFVNLDMEEYRDLRLTATVFQAVLGEPEFRALSAGIVLQAYLPDSVQVQQELTAWAQRRCQAGGAPIKVRLVKGANLAMEKVDAEWHGWHQAPYPNKADTDANYKRMIDIALLPENVKAVRVGVGSHNLFDVALALTLARDRQVEAQVDIEMLEGMAPAQARAVAQEAGALLLYAPIVDANDFGSALAYLVRRLDENTSAGNYLADLFDLTPDSPAWEAQRERFLKAWSGRQEVCADSRRASLPETQASVFANTPDTDWTQPRFREALQAALTGYRPPARIPVHHAEDIDDALERLVEGQEAWRNAPPEHRQQLLQACADRMAHERFASIAFLNDKGKKAIAEADAEVSEAIDFARYYAGFAAEPEGVVAQPLGTVVIAPPWNFPYAIPCGGVLAALAARNTVLLKPAPEAIEIGWYLVHQLWEAGIPRSALQFVSCQDGETGTRLITDPRSNAVVLTGSSETAKRFQEWRPTLPLFAETSGKNAILVSATADRELAARDLVRSAFGHSGQKCSAASLGILEAEVYDDPDFLRQVKDAAASLVVGPAHDLSSVVTPLVQTPSNALVRALTTLEEGEEWLLPPRQDTADKRLWSPGIKLGVRSGSWFHHTECFGPVLGLMRAADLEEGITFQNAVRFGLTAGLHALDEEEICWWKAHVEAGNLYINRGITGAVVQRQPFGGWKDSNVGPGAKAGGPHYVNLFRTLRDEKPPNLEKAAADYAAAWRDHFTVPRDPSGLTCESNILRYRPRKAVLLRLPKEATALESSLAQLASETTGVPLTISEGANESVEACIARFAQGFDNDLPVTLRTVSDRDDLEEELMRAAAAAGVKWIHAPLSAIGRIELTHWLEEQAICETRHRYGNLI